MAKAKRAKPSTHFKFNRNDIIGHPGAEDDLSTLFNCYVSTPELEIITDPRDPRSIIVGGTGSGKTALMEYIAETKSDNTIRIKLDDMSLQYISNSSVLDMLDSQNIKMDVVYQFIWRHMIAVQLIRYKYDITNREKEQSFWRRFSDVFSRNPNKKEALEYLTSLGGEFWNTTSECIKTTTTNLEKQIEISAGISLKHSADAQAGFSNKQSVWDQETRKILQNAVNSTQIAKLSKVFEFLNNEVFTNSMEPYYILIDELDTNWVQREKKYQLIRALIETVKTLRNVRNVKLVVALRKDLYDRIIDETRDEGFQEEKYNSLILELRWNEEHLRAVIDKRIDHLISSRYTNQKITLYDIEPKTSSRSKGLFEYMLIRSFNRPRHLIMFMNECTKMADGKGKLTESIVKEAEAQYSQIRLNAIKDEWGETYRALDVGIDFLRSRKVATFSMERITDDDIADLSLQTSDIQHPSSQDAKLMRYGNEAFDDQTKNSKFVANFMKMLFRTGLIGVKISRTSSYAWANINYNAISAIDIDSDTSFRIHPMFWRALGISPSNTDGFI
jgi:hypothetical protein